MAQTMEEMPHFAGDRAGGQACLGQWRRRPTLLGTEQGGEAWLGKWRRHPTLLGTGQEGQAWLRQWRRCPTLLEGWRVHGGPTTPAGGSVTFTPSTFPAGQDALPTSPPPRRCEVPAQHPSVPSSAAPAWHHPLRPCPVPTGTLPCGKHLPCSSSCSNSASSNLSEIGEKRSVTLGQHFWEEPCQEGWRQDRNIPAA